MNVRRIKGTCLRARAPDSSVSSRLKVLLPHTVVHTRWTPHDSHRLLHEAALHTYTQARCFASKKLMTRSCSRTQQRIMTRPWGRRRGVEIRFAVFDRFRHLAAHLFGAGPDEEQRDVVRRGLARVCTAREAHVLGVHQELVPVVAVVIVFGYKREEHVHVAGCLPTFGRRVLAPARMLFRLALLPVTLGLPGPGVAAWQGHACWF